MQIDEADAEAFRRTPLSELGIHDHPQIVARRCALARETTDPELLRMMAYNPHGSVRARVASNPHADADTLARLAADDDSGVRGDVTRNPSTPERVIVALTRDSDPDVRLVAWAAVKRRRRALPKPERDRLPWPPPADVRGLL